MERELDGLLDKLCVLERKVGGNSADQSSTLSAPTGDAFLGLKSSMAERLHTLKKELQSMIDSPRGKKGRNPRDMIKSQQHVREEIRLLDEDYKTLMELLQKNLKKKSKLSADELELRKEIVQQYASEIAFVKERSSAAYIRSPSTRGPNPFASPTTSDRYSASSSASTERFGRDFFGSPRQSERMTDSDHQRLSEIEQNDEEMDDVLDSIGSGVKELGVLARGINNEIVKQNVMLEGLEDRIDTTQQHVINVNGKMKETLKAVGRGGDKCMVDFICLVLLLGILAVVYNMAK